MPALEFMAPAMFVALVVFLIIGLPVAFSLAALGLISGLIAIELGIFPAQFMANLPYRVFGILSNELLLSIPFFTLMGAILERSGLAEDLLNGFAKLFGGLPGGLQVIPPSLVLIVLADQLGKSVGDMYLGAIGPSIAQILIFLLFILILSFINPKLMPPLPKEARTPMGWDLIKTVVLAILPSMALIFIVLGTIFMGLATPTEAGAMGVVGAMVLAAMHRRLHWKMLWQGMESTMNITVMVIFILIGATVFTLVFQGVDGGKWIEHLFSAMGADDAVTFLIIVNIIIFVLAFFLDFFEIAFIVLVLILIFYPQIVTGLLDKPLEVDIQQIEIKLDESDSGAQPNRVAPAEDPADYFKRK